MIKCTVCGAEDRPVYRSTPKGQPAKWVCEECLKMPPDPEVKKIVDILYRAGDLDEEVSQA